MLLHWEQLASYFGNEINAHRRHFDNPGESTYGLLCCRFANEHTRLLSNSKEHSEERLLQSTLWHQIEQAVQQWTSFKTDERSKAIVVLALNRSPCHKRCVPALFNSLNRLQDNYSRRFEEHWRFILACRGAYQGKVTDAGYYENATTDLDLRKLENAGWNVCVLQTQVPTKGQSLKPGEGLPLSGHQLLQALMRIKNTVKPQIARLE